MRLLGSLLLIPSALVGAISNVRILGTTPTQAIIGYTAPGSGGCTAEISETADAGGVPTAPLVNDVREDLFPGSSQDSRSGSITIGRARLFVAGKRVAEKSGTTYYSRALKAYTTHYFRIRCGADTATGTFRTANLAAGSSWFDPIPVDPSDPATIAWPTEPTSRNASVVDPQTGIEIALAGLQTDTTSSRYVYTSDHGGTQLCRPAEVATSDGKFGYHCTFHMYDANGLYWIEKGGASVRFLGQVVTDAGGEYNKQGCGGSLSTSMSTSDPNKFWCHASSKSGKSLIMEGVYTGHAAGLDGDRTGIASLQQLPSSTWTQITPEARSLEVLLGEFEPTEWPNFTTVGSYYILNSGVQEDKLLIRIWAGQDKMGWAVVFDPNKLSTEPGCVAHDPVYSGQRGCVVAAARSYYGGAGSANRWACLHQFSPYEGSGWIRFSTNNLGGGVAGQGAYYFNVTAVDGIPGAGMPASGGACPSRPADSPIPASEWPSSGCTLITVDGEPRADNPPTSIGPALPGDRIAARVLAGYADQSRTAEMLRLLVKNGNEWWVQRGYGDPAYYYARAQSPPLRFSMFRSSAHLFDAAGSGGEVWWDYANDPHGLAVAAEPSGSMVNGHYTQFSNAHYSLGLLAGYSARLGALPGAIQTPAPVYSIPSDTPFAGLAPIGLANQLEMHPSYSQSPVSAADASWFLDGGPYLGDTTTVKAANVSLVSGMLYKITGVSTLTNNMKRGVLTVTSGWHPLLDVSGAGSAISDTAADNYRYCMVLVSGECRAGSTPGEIYVNVPAPTNAYCVSSRFSQIASDICATRGSARLQAITQTDFLRKRHRTLGHGLTAYRGPYIGTDGYDKNAYWNGRALPDGTAVMAPFGTANGLGLFRVPPLPPPDSVNRTTFTPVVIQISSVPPGTNNVIAEFGYDDSFQCGPRQEACISVTGGPAAQPVNESTPFYWGSETFTGVSCAAGCAVTLPVLPQRVVYYRIRYRKADGSAIAAAATGVTISP